MQAYTTKPLAEAKFEAHRKYIDIQCIQTGCETLLWSPLAALTETVQPYDATTDLVFHSTPPQVTPLNLRAGEFAIFFPADGHAPGLAYAGPDVVRKVVIKVRA